MSAVTVTPGSEDSSKICDIIKTSSELRSAITTLWSEWLNLRVTVATLTAETQAMQVAHGKTLHKHA